MVRGYIRRRLDPGRGGIRQLRAGGVRPVLLWFVMVSDNGTTLDVPECDSYQQVAQPT